MTTYERIYDVVRRIPRGRVATYGQVGAEAGLAGRARQVGYAMAALPDESDVPWQRVVNAQGRISPRPGHGPHVQRLLLEEEGVVFREDGRLDLARYLWQPDPEWRRRRGLL